ncbi:MAG TPA: pirin family protein [candidate division Zixibacteria bacterium]|nr:pirin family protein [candidate division Zixibacteria bacterium]MDD4916625.1 pirin family protein [candidate division Zixibacteria bacterium]MDM7974138.1 pirin family protein [candidate division Zixibacteria bacterium]HOD65516.1 pirin family protein [candidate division Zixibacteria bacterium]HOZ08854.1 pirin family protein [candidate division Zixibacteria bacterium]
MVTVRRAEERGHFDHGWLDTYHTFSFDRYHDPNHMGFRSLRVINEDRIAPGTEFPMHPHRDMEIITYVLEGALSHEDSMGNGTVIRPGEVQKMTAGRGVFHSERNDLPNGRTHLLQIWIRPSENGLTPGYEQIRFDDEARRNRLLLIGTSDRSTDGKAVHINQDARLYTCRLDAGNAVREPLAQGRYAWVQVIRGKLLVNGHELRTGDGAALSGEREVAVEAAEGSEFLLFDLA